MVDALSAIFTERVVNGEALGDIADVFGKTIDEKAMKIIIDKATK